MKQGKRWLSVFLIILLAAGLWPMDAWTVKVKAATLKNPRIVPDDSLDAGQKVTWDCVWFGSYPQGEVEKTDPAYSVLEKATGWDSNNDIVIGNAKYRRMKQGDATYFNNFEGCYLWADSTSYHYFKYEPIKWRVLKVSNGQAFLRADLGLDDQKYDQSYGQSYISVTWETSTIRSWLNGYGAESNIDGISYSDRNFIGNAFTGAQRDAIADTKVINDDNKEYGAEGGNTTTDKVFLLSESEVYGTDEAVSYGFVYDYDAYDNARRCKSSDYAKAMGVWCTTSQSYADNCDWWLRSPGDNAYDAISVYYFGNVFRIGIYVYFGDNAVCPALNLKLSSSDQYTYAGTVCSDGTVHEEGKESPDEPPAVPESPGNNTDKPSAGNTENGGAADKPSVGNTGNGDAADKPSAGNTENGGTADKPSAGNTGNGGAADKPSDGNGSENGNAADKPSVNPPKDKPAALPKKGTKLTDTKTKASYIITKQGATVAYAGTTNKKATSITIPASVKIGNTTYKVTSIAANAFKNNKKLKKATISGNVASIGANAFLGCTALTTIKMGAKVTAIGDKAFYGCKKLSSITMGKNTASIGKSAFENCTAMKKATVPAKVKKIGSRAFYNCKKLSSLIIQSKSLTAKNVGSKAFAKAGNGKNLTVKVPKSKFAAYKNLLKKKGLSSKAKVKA